MEYFEILVYAVCMILTLIWLLGIRLHTKTREGVAQGTVNITMLFIVSLTLVPLLYLSPFHLIWMFPLAVVVGMLSNHFPFSLLSIPGYMLWRITCIGIDTSDVTHKGIYGLSLVDLHDRLSELSARTYETEDLSREIITQKYSDFTDENDEFDDLLRKIMKSLSKRVRDLDTNKKKLVKTAVLYGLAVASVDEDDLEDFVIGICRKYKLSSQDTISFMNFYDHNDEHLVFHITNEAQKVLQSDCPEDEIDDFIDSVASIAELPEFPDSVYEL